MFNAALLHAYAGVKNLVVVYEGVKVAKKCKLA